MVVVKGTHSGRAAQSDGQNSPAGKVTCSSMMRSLNGKGSRQHSTNRIIVRSQGFMFWEDFRAEFLFPAEEQRLYKEFVSLWENTFLLIPVNPRLSTGENCRKIVKTFLRKRNFEHPFQGVNSVCGICFERG